MREKLDTEIRFLPECDVAKAVDLTKRMWADSPRVHRHIKYELTDPSATYIAAYQGEKFVGYAGYCETMLNYDMYEFVWCNVDPEYQGQGIGRKLVEKRIELIRFLEGKLILLTTTSPQIYEHYGFKTLSVHQLYEPKPFHLMELKLDYDDDEEWNN